MIKADIELDANVDMKSRPGEVICVQESHSL